MGSMRLGLEELSVSKGTFLGLFAEICLLPFGLCGGEHETVNDAGPGEHQN